MKIQFSLNKERVLFTHESAKEYTAMSTFPAFMRDGPVFWAPTKVHVIYSIISRLKTVFKDLKIDKSVYDFMNQEMVLKVIPEEFRFFTKPMDFQNIALRYLYTLGSAGLLLDPGMGKSKVVLDYIALMGFEKSLIICPLPLLFVWEDEVKTHRPDKSVYCFETTNWDEEWENAKDKDIVCINYNKASLFKDKLKKVGFDFIHLDEFLIKDSSTNRTKDITELSRYIEYKCGGSGTLINNSSTDMFAPVRYLEPSLVGGSFVNFLDRYTYRLPVNKAQPNGAKRIISMRRTDEARSVLESCSIVMSKDEWLKLPEKKFHDHYIQPSDEQREFYSCLSRNYIAKLEDEFIEVDNSLTMMAKCYQVSNGFVYISDKIEEVEEQTELLAEEGKKKKKKPTRRTKFFKEQPKVKGMLDLIKNTIKTERAIIWYNCSAEYELISNALKDSGYIFLTIKGGTKNLGNIVRQFNNDPNYQFLVCQAKSVNYGITILGTTLEKLEESDIEIFPGISPAVHTQIFYSCNFSLEVFLQQQDRTHRIGQTHVCNYYRLWLNTAVEMVIKKALEDKMFIRKEMLVDIAEKLRNENQYQDKLLV